MKVLVYGAAGRVGREIVGRLRGDEHEVVGLTRRDGDLAPVLREGIVPLAPGHFVEVHRPDLVINCVAMNGMEQCSNDIERAGLLNGGVPLEIARACARNGVPMIHFSSDYVFSGSHNQAPLVETFPPDPCGVYGSSKLHGEAIVNWSEQNIVFRLSSIYGRAWEGPIEAVAQYQRGVRPIKVLHQFCAPTSARCVANAIAQVVRVAAGRWQAFGGIYHLATSEGVWKRDFAAAVIDWVFGVSVDVVEGELAEPRPVHTFLCTDKFDEAFDYRLPSWVDDLDIALPLVMNQQPS